MSNFIYTADNDQEGFALLNELACKGQGECYREIQKAIRFCNINPADENKDCIDYLNCDCMMDLLSVLETLSEYAYQSLLKIEAETVEKIKVLGTDCR